MKPLTMTAERLAAHRRNSKMDTSTGEVADELLREMDAEHERAESNWTSLERIKRKWEAERAAHQKTQAKLALRTGCAKCKGLGFTERHQPGHTHYETEGECPAYHFEKVPCISCGTGTVANNKQLAETQAITRELLEALGVLTALDLSPKDRDQWITTARARVAKAKGVLPAQARP